MELSPTYKTLRISEMSNEHKGGSLYICKMEFITLLTPAKLKLSKVLCSWPQGIILKTSWNSFLDLSRLPGPPWPPGPPGPPRPPRTSSDLHRPPRTSETSRTSRSLNFLFYIPRHGSLQLPLTQAVPDVQSLLKWHPFWHRPLESSPIIQTCPKGQFVSLLHPARQTPLLDSISFSFSQNSPAKQWAS